MTGSSAAPTSSGRRPRSRKAATRRSTWSARARSPPSPTRWSGGPFPSCSAAMGQVWRCRQRTPPPPQRRSPRWPPSLERDFELDLRVAMMPVSEIRAAGRDVRVARFAASEHCVYAMFSGGGAAWLAERAKLGEYALPAAKRDAGPEPFGPFLSMGRRAGQARTHPVGDRHAARRRPAIRLSRRGDRRYDAGRRPLRSADHGGRTSASGPPRRRSPWRRRRSPLPGSLAGKRG